MWTPGRNSSKTRRSPSTACKAKLWLKQLKIYNIHYLLIFVSLSYGFIIVFFFFRILHFRKKICLPIFAGLLYQYLNLKLKKKCVIFYFFFILYLILVKSLIICKLSSARNGVDRSGLYVAASCIVERIKCDREVDVFQSIKQMRQNRSQLICNMVSCGILEIKETF